MRKSFKWILTASLVAFAVIGCAKQGDLEKVVSRVDNIENRVGVLEEAVKQLNETDVPSLRELVRAIQNNLRRGDRGRLYDQFLRRHHRRSPQRKER